MHISFIGQVGLPPLSKTTPAPRERRVTAVAEELASQGHDVTVYGTKPHLTTGSFKGMQLVQVPSLRWALVRLLFTHQDTIHVQGIPAALAARLVWPLLPHRVWVVTVDALPPSSWRSRRLVRLALALADQVTVPTRALQYRLLNEFGVSAGYIPDGFVLRGTSNKQRVLRALPAGLRPSNYLVLLGEDSKALRGVVKAAKRANVRQRVAIVGEETPSLKRLATQFPKVTLVGALGQRQLGQLISSSAGAVLADATASHTLVLEIMAQAKPLVAVPTAQYQEVLGTTARFVQLKDAEGLSNALKEQTTDRKAELKARAARTRAKRHFTWARITEEYLQAYHGPETVSVPLDSARARTFTQPAPAQSL